MLTWADNQRVLLNGECERCDGYRIGRNSEMRFLGYGPRTHFWETGAQREKPFANNDKSRGEMHSAFVFAGLSRKFRGWARLSPENLNL